ncbi:MAG: ABC transporter ATP-binding protein [Limnochordia bacterium]|nr:ABC transporter ATP-binding protein [Limnochordia bacterium]
MIKVVNLTKQYGGHYGIEDLSFTVAKGEIVGLLGPNGAGKTTTIRVITGYLPPTSGSVEVAGYDIFYQGRDAKSRIGYAPENPPVYPDMTVKSYLTFVAGLKGIGPKRRKDEIERVIDLTSIEDVYLRLIGNCSKDYKQRLGLAQAMLGRPDVLIFDEPTNSLDPKQISEVRQLIRSLAGEHTVILSSHVLPEVSMVCDKVVIIDRGKLVAIDSPDGLARAIQGTQRILAKIKGPQDIVEGRIAAIDGVVGITAEVSGQHEWNYYIDSTLTTDIRERLFFQMSDIRCPILEIRPIKLSLEEVFLELTTEDKEVEEDA